MADQVQREGERIQARQHDENAVDDLEVREDIAAQVKAGVSLNYGHITVTYGPSPSSTP
jgi:hypothetical protein